MANPVYRSSIFVGEKNLMPTTTADGFRQLEREIPEFVANYLSLHLPSGGIYPSVAVPANNTYNYFWDPITGFYWAAYGHPSTNRWKLATNQVHTQVYMSSFSYTTTTAASLFQWDSTSWDNGCWNQVFAYTYVFPVPGYYLVSWKIDIALTGTQTVNSWIQTRQGTGGWSTVINGNTATASMTTTGATGVVQPYGITLPPSSTPYTVPTPYVQLQLMWQSSTAGLALSPFVGHTYMNIDLIGTYDSSS